MPVKPVMILQKVKVGCGGRIRTRNLFSILQYYFKIKIIFIITYFYKPYKNNIYNQKLCGINDFLNLLNRVINQIYLKDEFKVAVS
jgi:hypothetical protein